MNEMNELLIVSTKGNAHLKEGDPTPMFPLPEHGNDHVMFFLLFLGSAIADDDSNLVESMRMIRKHHRDLSAHSKSMEGKQYSYDTQ